MILDLIMPNLDGLGVIERLSSNPKRPKIVVLCCRSRQNYPKAINFGADYYIVKPFDLNILVDRIKQMVDINMPFQRHIQKKLLVNIL